MEEFLSCTKCSLCFNRTNIVFGEGNINSEVMILGETPGYSEDKQGRPFVGRSGKLLTLELRNVGLNRPDDFYITNVVKCRPENNRTPFKEEIKMCSVILAKEVTIMKPKVILTLGSTAAEVCFGKPYKVKDLRGKVFKTKQADIICTYHPSAILRDENNYLIDKFRDDLRILYNYVSKYINNYI